MKDLCSSYTEKKKKRDVLDIAALTSLKISRALADGKSKTASYFAALGDGFFCGTPERTLGDRIDNNATLRGKSGVRETLGMREDRRAARAAERRQREPRLFRRFDGKPSHRGHREQHFNAAARRFLNHFVGSAGRDQHHAAVPLRSRGSAHAAGSKELIERHVAADVFHAADRAAMVIEKARRVRAARNVAHKLAGLHRGERPIEMLEIKGRGAGKRLHRADHVINLLKTADLSLIHI